MDWCFKLEYVLCFTRVSNLIINIIYNNPDPDIIINHPDRPSWFKVFPTETLEPPPGREAPPGIAPGLVGVSWGWVPWYGASNLNMYFRSCSKS